MKLSDKPIMSLGLWEPTKSFSSQTFIDRLNTRLTSPSRLYADIRTPDTIFSAKNEMEEHGRTGMDWHRDQSEEPFRWLIVWANTDPTEIHRPDGTVFQGQPNEIIAFDNVLHEHRIPRVVADPENRLFARCWIHNPDQILVFP